MSIAFEKYHGAGNDFVVIDDRDQNFDVDNLELVRRMCHRRLGVGSDGLMLIRSSESADFEMIFFNPDGSRSLCGNGSRCAVDFASRLGLAGDAGKMLTTDGMHDYRVRNGRIGVSMRDVEGWKKMHGGLFFDTGSPHLVRFTPNVDDVDVEGLGRDLRYHPDFEGMHGVNVNFVSRGENGQFRMRTYERGVEGETLSCGTGATAAALAVAVEYGAVDHVQLQAPGGVLGVEFEHRDGGFNNIWLEGPTKNVFSGLFHVGK